MNTVDAKKLQAWKEKSGELAQWASALSNRGSWGFGCYKPDGSSFTNKNDPLTLDRLAKHFSGEGLRIGLHAISPKDSKTRWGAADLDAHNEINTYNFEVVKKASAKLLSVGITPIAEDSNGKGGWHLWAIFATAIPAENVRRLMMWAIDYAEEFEIFPKQDTITEDGYGNFLRLPGKHHKRDHWSTFWDAATDTFVTGADAPAYLLGACVTNDPSCIPLEALEYDPPKAKPVAVQGGTEDATEGDSAWLKAFSGNLRTLRMVDLLEASGLQPEEIGDGKYGIVCPWQHEHTTDSKGTAVWWQQGEFPSWKCLHKHCEHRGHISHLLTALGTDRVDSFCEEVFATTDQKLATAYEAFPELAPSYDTPSVVTPEPVTTPAPAAAEKKEKKIKQYDYLAQKFYKETCRQQQYPLYTGQQTYFYSKCRYIPCREIKMKVRNFFNQAGISQSNTVVENVTPIFQSYCWKDYDTYGEMPFWAGDNKPFKDAKNIIAYSNGLLDTTNIDAGLIPHSPNWCSVSCLSFGYEPTAQCPLWLKFLGEVFEGDSERIALLQEFIGYCLTADTSLQKALMLVGKPRSGKGTIQRIVGELVGKDNSTGYNLDSLTSEFGMAGLMNKSVALVGEVEINAKDSKRILERWKSILGEDVQKIERKYLDAVSCRLPTRFVVAANGLPRFMDASGAMGNRLLWLPFEKSWFGKEDTDLEGKLVAELPGIANWGIEGLKRLRANKGKFTIGKASKKIELKYQCETASVAAWVDLRCKIDPTAFIARDAAYEAYCEWCADLEQEPSSNVWFARDLRNHITDIEDKKIGGSRVYQGFTTK